MCFATSRETASAVALVRVPRECRLRVEGHSSHVEPRSCTEGERPLASVGSSYRSWADLNQRGTARARVKLALFATSREAASAVALARVPRECRLRVRGHSSHVAQQSFAERERPPAGAVPSIAHTSITYSTARRARVASSRVLPPPERQPA